MSASSLRLRGRVIGHHTPAGGTQPAGQVVHVEQEQRPVGPAENAFLYVEHRPRAIPRARYISWINLHDIEFAGAQAPGTWELVEPGQPLVVAVEWHPFGWGSEPLPNVAYVLPA